MTAEGFNLWGASKTARQLGLSPLYVTDEPAALGWPYVVIYEQVSTLPPDPLVGPYRKVTTAIPIDRPRRFPYGIPVVPDH